MISVAMRVWTWTTRFYAACCIIAMVIVLYFALRHPVWSEFSHRFLPEDPYPSWMGPEAGPPFMHAMEQISWTGFKAIGFLLLVDTALQFLKCRPWRDFLGSVFLYGTALALDVLFVLHGLSGLR